MLNLILAAVLAVAPDRHAIPLDSALYGVRARVDPEPVLVVLDAWRVPASDPDCACYVCVELPCIACIRKKVGNGWLATCGAWPLGHSACNTPTTAIGPWTQECNRPLHECGWTCVNLSPEVNQ